MIRNPKIANIVEDASQIVYLARRPPRKKMDKVFTELTPRARATGSCQPHFDGRIGNG